MKTLDIRRNRRHAMGIGLLVLLLGLLLTHAVSAQRPDLEEAPARRVHLEPGSPRPGFVPPPMDLSHLAQGSSLTVQAAADLPSAWDWRDQGGVTPIQHQGACGSCYAFAALADLESKMLVDGAGTYDLSENHAKECNWYELTHTNGGNSCSGGNYWQLVNLFSKQGIVLESCDPYVPGDVSCSADCPYQKTLLDWRIISGSAVPSTDALKQYVRDNGPVYTTLYAGSDSNDWGAEFGTYDGSYTLHYTGGAVPNHAVLIVGWDDSLPHAGGTGGWIVKNSWGTSWGAEGYFTIAYGSAGIGKYSSFAHAWQDYDDDGEVLYYDEGGWSTSWGCGSTTVWGLVAFTPAADVAVTRVEVWTTDATTDVDVYLYDSFDGAAPGSLLAQQLNSSFDEPGYHSIPLDSPVSVSGGDDVVALVKVANAAHRYPLVADQYGPPETGRTYLSCSGESGSWTDLGTYADHDVAIRLRTGSVGVEPGDPHESNDSQNQATPISYGDTLTDPIIAPAGDADYYTFSGSAGDPIAADVDAGSLSPPSQLDATLSLLDASGAQIAYNDDHDGVDPRLEATLPADGTYYLKVVAYNHPDEGGEGYVYALSLDACHWADLDCDGSVSAGDIQALASRWRCALDEDGCYDARCDADGDGVITVVDIAQAAAAWGSGG